VYILSIFIFDKPVKLVEILAVVIVGICLVVYQLEKKRTSIEAEAKNKNSQNKDSTEKDEKRIGQAPANTSIRTKSGAGVNL